MVHDGDAPSSSEHLAILTRHAQTTYKDPPTWELFQPQLHCGSWLGSAEL